MPPTRSKIALERASRDYLAATQPAVIEVPPARFLAIEGRGEPGGAAFNEKMEALVTVAQALRRSGKVDHAMGTVEGLWWTGNGPRPILPSYWSWKLLLKVPDTLTRKDVEQAIRQVRGASGAPVAEVFVETLEEGPVMQMLHIGPYADEQETLDQMSRFSRELGLELHGPHHEIYLSDPRKTPKRRLRTLVRYPIKRTGGEGPGPV